VLDCAFIYIQLSTVCHLQGATIRKDDAMKLYWLFVFMYNARFEVLTAVVSRRVTNETFCQCTPCNNSLQNVVEWLSGNYFTVKAMFYTGEYRYPPHNDVSVNDGSHIRRWSHTIIIQSDQKVSVHLIITTQKVTSNIQSVPCQSPDIYWH
jgi:hypothetical protein